MNFTEKCSKSHFLLHSPPSYNYFYPPLFFLWTRRHSVVNLIHYPLLTSNLTPQLLTGSCEQLIYHKSLLITFSLDIKPNFTLRPSWYNLQYVKILNNYLLPLFTTPIPKSNILQVMSQRNDSSKVLNCFVT